MRLEKGNILILTHWSFQDALIQAYTLPYVLLIRKHIQNNRKIFLVTFEQDHLTMSDAVRKEKELFLESHGIKLMTFKYSNFNLKLPLKAVGYITGLIRLIKKEKIGIIHAWCTPAGSLGYILCKLTGCKLIIDSYEPHAEAMVENGTWKKGSFQFHILFFLEKRLSKYAEVIISATEGMHSYARQKYSIWIERFYVKPACVDLTLFNRKKIKDPTIINEFGLAGKTVVVYAGKFGGIYLTREVFQLFKVAENKWGDNFRALILTNHSKEEIFKWSDEAGLSRDKLVIRFVLHSEINLYMGCGDFGITPVKSIPTKRYCSPIKDGEYWGLGLPVIITKDISDDSEIIEEENIGAVLNSLTTEEYIRAIDKIGILLQEGNSLAERIVAVAERKRSFDIADKVYKEIYS